MLLTAKKFSQDYYSKGFTLVELMLALTILSILSAYSLPNMSHWISEYKLKSAYNQFYQSLMLARSLAITQGFNTQICISENGRSCTSSGTWQMGWIVWSDVNKNGLIETNELKKVQPKLRKNLQIQSSLMKLTYDEQGYLKGVNNGSFIFSYEKGISKRLVINKAGRPRQSIGVEL